MWYAIWMVLFFAAGAICAHRLVHAVSIVQVAACVPLVLAAWAGVLLSREMNDYTALAAIGTADTALFGLGVLGTLRMLGGFPASPPSGDGDGGSDVDDSPQGRPSGEPDFDIDWRELDRMRASWQQDVRISSRMRCPARRPTRKHIPR